MALAKYGVIDLGTNTFHLLIVAINKEGQLLELDRRRVFVKLAEDGIQTIGPRPYQRGIEVLYNYNKILREHQISNVKALGTAALRMASNGSLFIKDVKQKTGIDIEVITGDMEAALIHRGVMKAVDLGDKKGLIMDIGGGSVEFIIADVNKVYWAKSFPVGVAILYNHFHKSEPIASTEIEALENFLESTLQPLLTELQNHQINTLVGASGTFDVIEDFLSKSKITPHSALVELETFIPFYQGLLELDLTQRLELENLPHSRAELIVVALILINFILQKASIKQIVISAFAMKEGILYKMIDNEQVDF